MKNNSLFLSMAAAALMATFAACSNDLNESIADSSTIRFSSKVINSVTRGGAELQETQIASGVNVGLFANKIANNTPLLADGAGTLTPSTTLKWPSTGNISFYAYAPYSADATSESLTFSVKDNQSEDADYLASDLLFGVPSTNPVENGSNVTLNFKHMLSKVVINVNITDEETQLVNPVISLLSVNKTVTMSTTDGTLSNGSNAGDVIVQSFSTTATATDGNNTLTGAAVIVPQTVAKGNIIQITTGDNKKYNCPISADKTFEAGKTYTLNVAFGNQGPVLVASSTLDGWTDGDEEGEGEEIEPKEVVTYTVGDYLTATGEFVKAADASKYTNIIGVIFSTEVSATDAAAGYKAYILGMETISTTQSLPQGGSDALPFTAVSNLTEFAADLDGLTKTSSLTDAATNYPLYDLSGESLTDLTGAGFSQWYIPSVGQFIQILNNLGKANIPTSDTYSRYAVIPELSKATTNYETAYQITWDGNTYMLSTTPENIFETLQVATNGKQIIKSSRYATSSLCGSNVVLIVTESNQVGTSSTIKYINSESSDVSEQVTMNHTHKDDDGDSLESFDYRTNSWQIGNGGATTKRNRIAVIATKSSDIVAADAAE